MHTRLGFQFDVTRAACRAHMIMSQTLTDEQLDELLTSAPPRRAAVRLLAAA